MDLNQITYILSNCEDTYTDINKNETTNEDENIIDELINEIHYKINNIETIEDSLIEDIYSKLKYIKMTHDKKINKWFDLKYNNDLNNLKQNVNNHLLNKNLTTSFIIINDKK